MINKSVPLQKFGSGTDLLKENTLLPAPTRGDYLLQTKAQSIINWMVGSNTGLQLRSPKWALEIVMRIVKKAAIVVTEDSHLKEDWATLYINAVVGNNPNYQYIENAVYSKTHLSPGSTPHFCIWETDNNWGHLKEDGTISIYVDNIGHIPYVLPEHLK